LPDGQRENAEDVLTGTTLQVYIFLVKRGAEAGPREVQRALGLSSPSLASFHLEKLAKSGLASKNSQGEYEVEKVYLKHYLRLRRFLVPRYMFYAATTTFLLLGWIVMIFIGSVGSNASFLSGLHSNYAFILTALLVYGIAVGGLTAFFFWYETARVLKMDQL
jgi:hypothetical protein